MALTKAFRFLEINIMSAFDLDPPKGIAAKDLKTYAVVWIDPAQKLRSSVSESTDPKWNDRFVFLVDDDSLNRSLTAAELVVELYAVKGSEKKKKKDKLLGTSRVLLGTLAVNCGRDYRCGGSVGAFRALNVRRSDGLHRDGVLQIGATVLEGLVYRPTGDDDHDRKFVGIGSAIDCKALARARSKVISAGNKGVGEAFWGFVRSFV